MAINIDTFKQVEIKVGTVQSAERVPDSDKLLRLEVDLGEAAPRQILSGIAEFVTPESLVGKQFPFVANLEPRTIRGLESNGMLLALGDGDGFVMLTPERAVPPGTAAR